MDRSYTWYPDKIYPYESQWSLLHKFCYWNAYTANALHRIIGGNPYPYANLARHLFVDIAVFGQITGLNEIEIRRSLAENYLNKCDYNHLCDVLRYCPKCIRSGYHSSIFQLYFIELCPIHYINFETTCLRCSNVVLMDMSGKSFRAPYSCPNCKKKFYEFNSLERIDSIRFNSIEDKANEIEKIKNLKSNYNLHQLSSRKSYKQPHIDSYLIYSRWKDMYLINKFKNLHYSYYKVSFRKREGTSQGDYYKVYNSIRRYLYIKYVKKHVKCLREFQQIGSAYPGFSCDQPSGCPIALAYSLWRLYWEQRVFLTIDRHVFPTQTAIGKRLPNFLNKSAKVRGFAFLCIESFLYFYKEACNQEQKQEFRIPEIHEIERASPYVHCWITTIEESKNTTTFHVWKEAPDLTLDEQIFSSNKQHLSRVVNNIETIRCRLTAHRHVNMS